MSQLDDVRKLRVVEVETDEPVGSMEPVALYKPDGTVFAGGAGSNGGGLGTELNRSNESGMVTAVTSSVEITPADPTKGTLVSLYGTGGTGGSELLVGSWDGYWGSSIYLKEGVTGAVVCELGVGETYLCDLGGSTFVRILERTRG